MTHRASYIETSTPHSADLRSSTLLLASSAINTQDHHLDPESLLCPNLIFDVSRVSVHFGEKSHNPPTSSLTFRLRNIQSLPPISDNPYYPLLFK